MFDDGDATERRGPQKPVFWTINIGHVLTILGMLGGGLIMFATVITKFSEMGSQLIEQSRTMLALTSTLDKLNDERAKTAAAAQAMHAETITRFDAYDRHLDQLDWQLQHPSTEAPMTEPARRRR